MRVSSVRIRLDRFIINLDTYFLSLCILYLNSAHLCLDTNKLHNSHLLTGFFRINNSLGTIVLAVYWILYSQRPYTLLKLTLLVHHLYYFTWLRSWILDFHYNLRSKVLVLFQLTNHHRFCLDSSVIHYFSQSWSILCSNQPRRSRSLFGLVKRLQHIFLGLYLYRRFLKRCNLIL
jgi:hypothetical protein